MAESREASRSRRPAWLTSMVAAPGHGPLPSVLLVLTVTTGIVDAVSLLSLGRVFVANMTGNVVFVGFALAGAPGFSLTASLVALAGFLVGAGLGGVVATRYPTRRGRLLLVALVPETLLLAAAAVILATAAPPYTGLVRSAAVACCAVALGLQNAAARRLAVPDFTTTVLTMTLTGIAADLRHGSLGLVVRRLSSVVAMLLGAVVGALLVLHQNAATALALAALLVAAGAVTMVAVTRSDAPWQHPATPGR